jgi:hypothetical protein
MTDLSSDLRCACSLSRKRRRFTCKRNGEIAVSNLSDASSSVAEAVEALCRGSRISFSKGFGEPNVVAILAYWSASSAKFAGVDRVLADSSYEELNGVENIV